MVNDRRNAPREGLNGLGVALKRFPNILRELLPNPSFFLLVISSVRWWWWCRLGYLWVVRVRTVELLRERRRKRLQPRGEVGSLRDIWCGRWLLRMLRGERIESCSNRTQCPLHGVGDDLGLLRDLLFLPYSEADLGRSSEPTTAVARIIVVVVVVVVGPAVIIR